MIRRIAVAILTVGWVVASQLAEAADIPDKNPLSGNEKAIQEGRTWYRSICSLCHGGNADGAGERASSARRPADLRKFSRGFRTYVESVKNGMDTAGRGIKDMPAWGGVLDDQTIYQIGAYLETLAIEGANWKEGAKN